MGNFVGNINNGQENLCVTATRGHLFVPGEDGGGKAITFTKKKTILACVSIAVILALILGVLFFIICPQRLILPKYNKLCGMLGDSKADVTSSIPKEAKYAGTTFKIVPYYENDVLHGFSYTATFEDPEAAAETAAKIIKKMHRVMGESYAQVPTAAGIKAILKNKSDPSWRWDATEHSPNSVEKYMEGIGYAKPAFVSIVRIEKQESGTSLTMSFMIVDDVL